MYMGAYILKYKCCHYYVGIWEHTYSFPIFFLAFCKKLDPQYVMPSRKNLTQKLLPDLDNVVMKEVNNSIDNAKYVALTTDGWQAPTAESYMAYTAHFLDLDSGELVTKILECARFDKSHHSENLQQDIERICTEYNLWKKIVNITADNAPNIQLAIRLTGIDVLGCLAHLINLIIKNAISQCPEVVTLENKMSDTINYLKKSANADKFFVQCQKATGTEEKKLLLDVRTRWNSFYLR